MHKNYCCYHVDDNVLKKLLHLQKPYNLFRLIPSTKEMQLEGVAIFPLHMCYYEDVILLDKTCLQFILNFPGEKNIDHVE